MSTRKAKLQGNFMQKHNLGLLFKSLFKIDIFLERNLEGVSAGQ
jgi:hypothetical protein